MSTPIILFIVASYVSFSPGTFPTPSGEPFPSLVPLSPQVGRDVVSGISCVASAFQRTWLSAFLEATAQGQHLTVAPELGYDPPSTTVSPLS